MLTGWRARLGLLRQFKVQLLTALGVGLVAGVAGYFSGPWVAAGLNWLAGVTATLALQLGLSVRRFWNPGVSNA